MTELSVPPPEAVSREPAKPAPAAAAESVPAEAVPAEAVPVAAVPVAAVSAEAAAVVEPEFRRRREIGAASARSLLLTVLGEFVLPAGRPVWTSTFLRALAQVGVAEHATRQALARTGAEGWLESRRRGRRTSWELTASGRRLLSEGAEWIYGFGRPVGAWDRRWLVVLASVPEPDRRLRHLLRTRLTWNGLGNLSAGVWVSPHAARVAEVREVLERIGVADSCTVFVAELGFPDEASRVAGRAWDLAEIDRAYARFLAATRRLRPSGPAETFAAQVRLVQEWRRFPFLDPGLPGELLPEGWSGARAAARFHDRYRAWRPAAGRYWRDITNIPETV